MISLEATRSFSPNGACPSLRKVVFLDRDGTLNVDHGYVFFPERLEIFPGIGVALAQLKAAGFDLVIVSNQSAIGRGMCSVADVEATNRELQRQLCLEDSNAKLDRILYCPHAPEDCCGCRKPGIGMLSGAIPPVEFDKNQSWMIGDKDIDVEFGENLGLPKTHCQKVDNSNPSMHILLVISNILASSGNSNQTTPS